MLFFPSFLPQSVEFFLNKDVTHFVTDKLQPSAAVGETGELKEPPYCASPSSVTTNPTENLSRIHHRQIQQQQQRSSRQLLHLTHQQQTHGQYVNDYGPATSRTSSPCPPPITSTAAPSSSAGACTTASGAASVQQKHVVVVGSGTVSSSTAASVGFDGKNSPVHLARSWGTLIWSAEYALKFLRKVLSSLPSETGSKSARIGVGGTQDVSGRPHRHHHHRHQHQSHGSASRPAQHVHHLRGRFVKIESRSAPGNYRPVYQEFKRWPVLLRTEKELAGRKAPFADVNEAPDRKQALDEQQIASRKKGATNEPVQVGTPVEGTSTSRMTRKLASAANSTAATRTATTTTATTTGKSGESVVKKRALEKVTAAVPPPPRDCGYCEICRIEYDSLATHVQSESHQTFVQNDDNFLSLDRLLDSFGAGDGGGNETAKLAEEEGYDAEGGGGAVTAEAFFQQLHNTTRIKRGAGEELLYERKKPIAHHLKAIGVRDKRKEKQEKEEEDGEGRSKTTTVTVAVTTTTTAAADELIERQNTPIGKRTRQGEAEINSELQTRKETQNTTTEENEVKSCEKSNPRGKVKRKRTTSTVNDCEQQKCEGKDKTLSKHHESSSHDDSDSDGAKKDHAESGNNTQELIKLAIQSVIATFDCSDSDFLAEVEKTLDDSVRVDDSVVGKQENRSVKERADISPVGESVSDKRAANSSRHSLTNRDSSSKEGQRTSRVRSCKQLTEAAAAVSVGRRGERRSDRLSGSSFRQVKGEGGGGGALDKLAEHEESSEGMFGRRSAIHHHPHNQLNHHNHQKHKSTLSALLLKQQQERAQQQQQQLPAGHDQQWEESKATDSSTVLDHAAGMKVITDFCTKQQEADDELVEDKSVLLSVVPATSTPILLPTSSIEDGGQDEETAPVKPLATGGGGRRKRNPRTEQQQDDTSMGLKASTVAMNKHHHHHHVAHLNESGSGTGTKTRHATELAATLLECDGLDPKNTKRISLGLRQNPKRANLNEDFTSLLDETLERSKTASASTSVKRTAQSRIRVPPKAKEQQTVTIKQQQVEDEKPNRGCEDEETEMSETLELERLKPVIGSNKRSSASTKKTVTLEDIKVRGIRWRAPSPTTRPPVKSPLLYKVIDNQAGEEAISSSGGINTPSSRSTTTAATLQSSRKDHPSNAGSAVGSSNAQSSHPIRACKSSKVNGGSPGKKNGLIVKIRRVRQSELSLLNDEAENFMFPRKDDSSSEEETDDDRQTSSEGFHAGLGTNNYTIDITSSSEVDRGMMAATTTTMIKREVEEKLSVDEEIISMRREVEKQPKAATTTSVAGSRKRKKAIPASAHRASSLESSDHLSSPISSRTSPTLPNGTVDGDRPASVAPAVKRARLETASRRKGQQTADYEKGQDPVDTSMRFPEAPIQPYPVAAAKTSPSSADRARRRRSQSCVSEEEDDGHDTKNDDDDDDDAEQVKEAVVEDVEEKVEEQKVVVKQMRGKGSRGRRGARKMNREDTVTSTTSIGPCPSCTVGTSRGRGRGGFAGRRGRRGGRGGGVGRGGRTSRLQSGVSSSCTCHLLDATRMPPPSSRRRTNESVERASTSIISPRKTGTRASKTKTTPPSAAAVHSPSSLASASFASDDGSIMASSSICGSYSKGKEDGMGAVFKWINFRKRCEEIEPYRFAFERVPSLEPWYETFQRQDDGTEKVYEYFGSTGYRKLPYEMGPLPALGQNCCILNYKLIASRKSNRTTSLQSSSSASMEPGSPGGRKGSRPNSSDVLNVGGGTGAGGTVDEVESKKSSPSSSSLSSLPLKKRKLLLQESGNAASSSSKTDQGHTTAGEGSSNSSRIARLIAGANERPRKSPREHASTLAILSLLQQQQHRKRAGTIKILTSPKKATTAAATQTTTSLLHEQLLHQDADSNGEEQSRSCSRASDRASSRAGSSNGGIKFDRPLFPDSSYVNSRTLCQELDAFLSDELKRVAGKDISSTLGGIVKKEFSDIPELEETDEHAMDEIEEKSHALPSFDEVGLDMDQDLLLPPSIVQEGIAIERNELPISKRDLLDVLQTVGTEPPLSLKLVQRCESVVKKIVQYDRKERPMVASGTGSGLAISSGSPVIGLQLFDSGSALAACGPGSGPGSVGGSFLKKRINRTGWPTNKRKIGTRTRQQARFMLPSLSVAKKSLSRESIKKEPAERQQDEIKEEVAVLALQQQQQQQQQSAIKNAEAEDEEEEDDDNEEDDEEEDNEEEDENEEDEEEDDAETVVEDKVDIRSARALTVVGESLPGATSSSTPGSGPMLGVNCYKYVTKTTTTMTRVDYGGGGTATNGGPSPPKRKHSREAVTTNNEEEADQQPHPKEDQRPMQQSSASNRHRTIVASGSGNVGSTAIGSVALTTTHDSDDKECDSISSRSIFVSDDCDTTSSSMAINPPDDRPPSTSELPSSAPNHNESAATSAPSTTVPSSTSQVMNPRLTTVRVRRKESSDNEETIRSAEDQSVNHLLANKSTKSPRTPSERIRNNKMVKNRRVTVRTEQAKAAGGGVKRSEGQKKHHDVKIRTTTSSKRRKSSALGPPLPPPSMMPLSPPLTTSTSSSSSSSYGADDKPPLSPTTAVSPSVRGKVHECESVEEEELRAEKEQTIEQYSSGANTSGGKALNLTPSKIKTRSSTFGYSPPKRTYGAGKLSPKKLPFVSLVKTNYVQIGEEGADEKPDAATIANGKKDGGNNSSSSSTGNRNRRKKAVEKKPRKPSSPSVRKRLHPKQSVAMARKKKDSESVADVVASGDSDKADVSVGGKRSKKLTIKAKQLLARKQLKKLASDAATSGHFNNNSDTHSNDDVEKEEEDPLLCAIATTFTDEQQRERSLEQQNHHPEHYHRQQREPSRVHDNMEEHLIEEEDDDHHELMELEEEEAQLEEVGEEEQYELLEVEEVEEEDDDDEEMDAVAEEEEGEHHHHEDEEDDCLTGENVAAASGHHHHHPRQQVRRDEEERKLIMAEHDYSDQHNDADPPIADAEFVEVEELAEEEENHLEDDEEEVDEEEAEGEEEEEEEHDEDDDDDDDDDDNESTYTTVTAPPVVGFGKQQQQQQQQPRVKLTFTSSGGTPTVVMTSAGAAAGSTSTTTSTTTTKTFNSSSPTKYSPQEEENHLEDDEEEVDEEEAEGEEEEEEEHDEDDDDDDDDDDNESTYTTVTAPPVVGFGKQQQQQQQPRVKLTFTSSGGTPTVVMTSAGAAAGSTSTTTSTTTTKTFNSSSPTKYSP
uniref:DBF4-type domain-containing protein n=1 Tax=Anopheles christyi TaxID=43041 RepID=A0A182JW67_9DIPT